MKHSIDWNGSTGSRFHTTKKFPDILWTRSRCALDLSQKIIHLLGTQALLLWLHNRKNICRRLTKTKYRASSSSLSIESILSIFLFFLFCRLYAVFLQLLNVLVQNEEKKPILTVWYERESKHLIDLDWPQNVAIFFYMYVCLLKTCAAKREMNK